MNRNYGKLNSDNAIAYAPATLADERGVIANPNEAQYRARGYLPIVGEPPTRLGVEFVPTECGDIGERRGRAVIVRRYDERPVVAPELPVTRYSGWKMYKAIKAEGYGEAFDALMKADISVMIAFVRPQYFLSDDADFTAMVTQMCSALHIDDEAKDRILVASVDGEVR